LAGERSSRRNPSSVSSLEVIRAREEIADLRERLAYAYEQIRELSAKVPRGELHST
jgi:hypothetical protein